MEQQELTPEPHRSHRLLISVPVVVATLAVLGYASILYAPDFVVDQIYPLIYPSPYVPPKPVSSNRSSSSVSVSIQNKVSFLGCLPLSVKVAVSSFLVLAGVVIIVVIGVMVSRGLSQVPSASEEGTGKPASGDASEQTRGQESTHSDAGRVAGLVVGVMVVIVVFVVGIIICTKLGPISNSTSGSDVDVEVKPNVDITLPDQKQYDHFEIDDLDDSIDEPSTDGGRNQIFLR
jgi:hypothetical protein